MSRTAHIFLFIGYVIVAVIVGLAFPGGVLNVEDNGAWLLAGLVFLVGLSLHEMITRRQNEMTALRRLLVLRRAYDGAHEELERTRDEVRRVYEAMESVGQNAAEGGRELKEVASEVKVLHDLVEELYSTGNGMPNHALPPFPKEVEIEDALDDTAVFGESDHNGAGQAQRDRYARHHAGCASAKPRRPLFATDRQPTPAQASLL